MCSRYAAHARQLLGSFALLVRAARMTGRLEMAKGAMSRLVRKISRQVVAPAQLRRAAAEMTKRRRAVVAPRMLWVSLALLRRSRRDDSKSRKMRETPLGKCSLTLLPRRCWDDAPGVLSPAGEILLEEEATGERRIELCSIAGTRSIATGLKGKSAVPGH